MRGCDEKRNVLVYLIYSDKLVEGSPKNSTSSVPIMPWGMAGDPPKCADWLKQMSEAPRQRGVAAGFNFSRMLSFLCERYDLRQF